MAECTFYVATLSAAVERAARIAPNKGTAFDMAAGIVLHVDPEKESASLRATDLEVYYREEVKDVVDYGDEEVTWRLPSGLFAGILAGLPLDKEVTIEDDGERRVRIFCGRKQAKLRMMPNDTYPQWERILEDGLEPVSNFAHRVSQVAWAVDQDNIPFTGVNIDGEYLNATDRYRLARVPCKVPLKAPVTVAMRTLSPILKNLPGEVRMRAEERMLLLRVGDEIEATCAIYDRDYPDLSKALRDDFEFAVKVDREALHNAIEAMLVLVKNERYPRMNFDFEEGIIHLFMTVPETGDMSDIVEAEFDHSGTFSIDFTPTYLISALAAGTSKNIYWSLGPSKESMTRIKDDDYIAYIMPLSKGKTS